VKRTTMSVAAVSLKIPPFWPSDPEIWFAQVEAQFSTKGITTQKTKFEYIIASLTTEYATEVRDLILQPPDHNPYDTLKEQLIKRTAASEQRRLQQLFSAEELGDRKPTQLLRHMQQLLGDKASITDSSFLRELFLQRLPPNVRMVLASSADTITLEELASLADKIMEVATPIIATVGSSQVSAEIDQLRSEIASLKRLAETRTKPFPTRRTTRRTPSPAPQQSPSDLCWFHQRFGDNARKCRPPCAKSGNAPASH